MDVNAAFQEKNLPLPKPKSKNGGLAAAGICPSCESKGNKIVVDLTKHHTMICSSCGYQYCINCDCAF